ncbi:U4/U6.U5 tri-snRNP-associated protein 1 [Coccinella septempunctata]|uniref:U4/U6.U5 tri-snRNP-associated protein 1 n=1 Tax=Coccinella septempunctata TaxID=41139 RepID=UPI001D07C9DF|nr:U4/U6.U5 tri-snRNP-associated protein 1 [Coccinella septempunctata]
MGSSSKKHKDRESRKKRPASELDEVESPREKRHKHHHKHKHRRDKEKKREKSKPNYTSDDSDVVEVQVEQNTRKSSPERPSVNASNSEEANNGASVDSLSIEETNKLRAKLGLKPLEVGSSSTSHNSREPGESDDKYKDDWGEFHHKPAENWSDKAQQEKIRAKLAEQKEKRRLQSRYSKVKSLGQSDSEEDVNSWIDKSRKLDQVKREAERRAKALEELDAQFGINEIIESEVRDRKRHQYTARDLKGLKVDHNIDDIIEEKNVILTLKDKGVLEEEDDVLVNVNMVDDERHKKNLENRKKSSVYNKFEEEFDQFGNPIEKSVLSKYDEEIHGEKKETFTLGSDISFEARKQQAISEAERANQTKKKLEKIAEKELKLASEYYDETEMAKFKKPKKKVRKIRPKGKLLSADDLENMTREAKNVDSKKFNIKLDDLNIDDTPEISVPTDFSIDEKDDELEQAIHRARKIKQRENVVAELIQNTVIKTEIKEEPIDGSIVLNTTAEFCRTLGDIPTYGKAGNRDEAEELDMDFESNVKEDNSDEDVEIIEPTGWNSIDPNVSVKVAEVKPQEVQILDEEPDVSKGMGAALKVAMSKGYLEKEIKNRPSNSRLAHLQAQHYSIEDKVYGEDGERGGRRGDRYAGPIQDFKEKDGFKPNVKLEYIDDDGRILNSKEAFRYLSHKFHGKGPGKNKVEKRIKKNVQEQLMKKMSSTDTPLGTLNMLQAKQKESQSPYVVLSGNKQSQSTMISKIPRH